MGLPSTPLRTAAAASDTRPAGNVEHGRRPRARAGADSDAHAVGTRA
jgi:hypothetical protein